MFRACTAVSAATARGRAREREQSARGVAARAGACLFSRHGVLVALPPLKRSLVVTLATAPECPALRTLSVTLGAALALSQADWSRRRVLSARRCHVQCLRSCKLPRAQRLAPHNLPRCAGHCSGPCGLRALRCLQRVSRFAVHATLLRAPDRLTRGAARGACAVRHRMRRDFCRRHLPRSSLRRCCPLPRTFQWLQPDASTISDGL